MVGIAACGYINSSRVPTCRSTCTFIGAKSSLVQVEYCCSSRKEPVSRVVSCASGCSETKHAPVANVSQLPAARGNGRRWAAATRCAPAAVPRQRWAGASVQPGGRGFAGAPSASCSTTSSCSPPRRGRPTPAAAAAGARVSGLALQRLELIGARKK